MIDIRLKGSHSCRYQATGLIFFFSYFDIEISFKDPKLVYFKSFEMKCLQMYMGSKLYVGCYACMR